MLVVDLNANWSSGWRGGRPWDTYYPSPRSFSERETRIAWVRWQVHAVLAAGATLR